MEGRLLSAGVLLLLAIGIFRYIGYLEKKNEEQEEEKMAGNVVCQVDAPEGLTFQGHKVVSLKIANDGDADGYYVYAMEFDKVVFDDEYSPMDAALAEAFVDPWLVRGKDF